MNKENKAEKKLSTEEEIQKKKEKKELAKAKAIAKSKGEDPAKVEAELKLKKKSEVIEEKANTTISSKSTENGNSEPQEGKIKPKKLIFSMTSYEDIMQIEQEKKQKDIKNEKKADVSLFSNNKLTTADVTSNLILELLVKDNIPAKDDLFITLYKIAKVGIKKQGMVCKEFINSVKTLIMSSNEPKFWETVFNFIEIVKKLAYVVGGLHNSTKFVKNILQKIQNNKNIDRELILNKLDEFINTKINTKDIISYKHGTNLIKENDYILIYGKSQIFRKILTKAVQKKINFKVIYVDNKQNNYIKTEIEYLSKLGVNVVISYLNGISGIINKVTKVFVKAKSMLSNGSLLGDVGTSLISCVAYNFKKPVISFCETYKFWDKILMDPFQSTNTKVENVVENSVSYNKLNMLYDITPSNYINMVVCEHGYIPPTSVPVVIREFEKEEVEFE